MTGASRGRPRRFATRPDRSAETARSVRLIRPLEWVVGDEVGRAPRRGTSCQMVKCPVGIVRKCLLEGLDGDLIEGAQLVEVPLPKERGGLGFGGCPVRHVLVAPSPVGGLVDVHLGADLFFAVRALKLGLERLLLFWGRSASLCASFLSISRVSSAPLWPLSVLLSLRRLTRTIEVAEGRLGPGEHHGRARRRRSLGPESPPLPRGLRPRPDENHAADDRGRFFLAASV